MSKNRIGVVGVRAIRKASHLSGRAAHETGKIFNRVEGKANRAVIARTGSDTGKGSVQVDEFVHRAFPYLTPIHPALPQIGQKPSVTVFVPSLAPRGFYGGIATLLVVSAALANKLGYDYRVVQTSGFEKSHSVLEFLASQGIIIPEGRFSTLDVSRRTPHSFAYLPLHPEDVVVVSAWWDAFTASKLPLSKKLVYMVQDYEPIFYNNGDEQQLANSTYYKDNFIPFCNTATLHKFFKEKGYSYVAENAISFEPAVAKEARTDKPSKTARKLFLYGRTNVHRNLFYGAVKAINIAMQDEAAQKYDWELYSAGQADIPNIRLHSGQVIKNLGKMKLDEYYRFAKNVDIAVSPMLAPHPNYPTLELASMGAMVVTTKYETKQNLDMYSRNILLAEPTADDMAKYIVKALKTPETTRLKNLRANTIGDDWTAALDKPIGELIKRLVL